MCRVNYTVYIKMAGVKRRVCTDSDIRALHKELDEISCPICMEHPHNAVLLLCSSHDKGCRSYVCDTSYRHSNCLDRFKKLRASNNNASDTNSANNESDTVDPHEEAQDPSSVAEAPESESSRERAAENDEPESETVSESSLSLKCPLCRGSVLGWEVVEDARKYLNAKRRSCSRELCSFSGNYPDLRRHARRVHPTTRPSESDPSRERAWRRLEHQRELGDVVSAIRSAMPGAVVVGDYVIENGDRLAGEGNHNNSNRNNRPWLTTLFLFQMIGSVDNAGEPRARPRGWTRHRRSGGGAPGISERRFIWGENLLGLQDDEDDDDDDDGDGDRDGDEDEDLRILSDAGDDASPVPRRRRRLARSRSDEDQP